MTALIIDFDFCKITLVFVIVVVSYVFAAAAAVVNYIMTVI